MREKELSKACAHTRKRERERERALVTSLKPTEPDMPEGRSTSWMFLFMGANKLPFLLKVVFELGFS